MYSVATLRRRRRAGGPVFADVFTGGDGSSPDSTRWTVQESSGSTADIQGGELRLLTGGSGSVGGFEDYSRMIGLHRSVVDCRVDYACTIPDELPQWFFLVSLRGDGTWASDPTFPNFPGVGYWCQLANPHGTAVEPVCFIGKADATGTTKVDLSAQDGLELPANVDQIFVRFQVTNENGDVRVRASARDQANGPIPDGSWDIDVLDDTGTIFTSGGVVQVGLGGSDTANEVVTVFVDQIKLVTL